MLILGNLCLCASIALPRFTRNFRSENLGWIDFVHGFLLGMALILFFWVARTSRRDRASGEAKS